MYITKLFVPAMLVLSGLAQARPAADAADTDIVALSTQDTSLLSDTALLSRHDPDPSNPDPPELSAREDEAAKDLGAREPQSQRPWCRDDEYWDRFWRRCRRYPPLPRPVCRREERAYCGRGRRDWVPYDENNPYCRQRGGYRTFCSRPGREDSTIIIIGGGQ